MLEIKTLMEMKTVFDGTINRLGMTKERISDHKGRSIETSQSEI